MDAIGFVQRWSHHPHGQFLELLSGSKLDDELYEFAIELERIVEINCIFLWFYMWWIRFFMMIYFDLLLFFVLFTAFL